MNVARCINSIAVKDYAAYWDDSPRMLLSALKRAVTIKEKVEQFSYYVKLENKHKACTNIC